MIGIPMCYQILSKKSTNDKISWKKIPACKEIKSNMDQCLSHPMYIGLDKQIF